jgi:hypothetical protein
MAVSNERGASGERVLKRDLFGTILVVGDACCARIVRDTAAARLGLRWLARWLARNEARALSLLDGLDGVPRALPAASARFQRSYIAGRTMLQARPRDPGYFRAARRLLAAIHRIGVAHNDLAKEANWLVDEAGRPALVDFQLAWRGSRRSRSFRLLAREDLRHLLKHKRTYCPERLTPSECRLLARPSWLRRAWFASGKPVYRFVTRRLLRWRDNEGHGSNTREST